MTSTNHLRAFAAKAYELGGAINLPLEYLDALIDAAIDPKWAGDGIPAPVAPASPIPGPAWVVQLEGGSGLAGARAHHAPRQAFTTLLDRVRSALQACGAPASLLAWWDAALESEAEFLKSSPRLDIASDFQPQEWVELGSGQSVPGAFLREALASAEDFDADEARVSQEA